MMEHLGYMIIDNGECGRVLKIRTSGMNFIGNKNEPTVYGVTKTSISIVKTSTIPININGIKTDMKCCPIRAKSALTVAKGLSIELGRNMLDLIEIIKYTDSLFIVNKIGEKRGKVLWGIIRMGAGRLPLFEIGSILTVNNAIVRFTPNHELRKSEAYREIMPLSLINTLAVKSDFKSDGYSNRYMQVIKGLSIPLGWAVTGVTELSDTNVNVKVRNEIGDYIYRFTLDSDDESLLRLTDVVYTVS